MHVSCTRTRVTFTRGAARVCEWSVMSMRSYARSAAAHHRLASSSGPSTQPVQGTGYFRDIVDTCYGSNAGFSRGEDILLCV